MATQKVVIPKGLVNPNETTIVEIPKNLQDVSTVVARPRRSSSASPTRPTTYRRKTELNKSFPKAKMGGAFKMLHEKGTSYGGFQDFGESTQMNHSPSLRGELSSVFGRRHYEMPGDFVGPFRATDISDNEVSYREFRKYPQNPLESTPKGFDDPADESMYRDFLPPAMSSGTNVTSNRTPPSMARYHHSSGSAPENASYHRTSTKTSSPEGTAEEVTEESWPVMNESGSPNMGSSPDYSSECYEYESPCYDTRGNPVFPPEYNEGGNGGRELTQSDILSSLGELETSELSQIMTDLSKFQSARRQLIFDASSLSSPADVSSSLMSP